MITTEEKRVEKNGQTVEILAANKFIINIAAPQMDKNHNLIDAQSVIGRFGWVTLEAQHHIPYIFRQDGKYCSVRMFETKLLDKYLSVINNDIYQNCTNVMSYYATESERRLLNEINTVHCDFEFGKLLFSQNDLLVRLDDAIEFYKFLVVCYKKLFNANVLSGSCGFITIDNSSVVPYVMLNEDKYLPLFYFEGAEHLEPQAKILKGWHLAYLKFCFKIQEIRKEFLTRDTCTAISFDAVKQFFPPDTTFKDFWPSSVAALRRQPVNKSKPKIWHRQPTLQATGVCFMQAPATTNAK